MALTPATNKQLPDHAILDHFNKQAYLGQRFTYSMSFTASGTSETAALYLAAPMLGAGAFQTQLSLFVDMRRLIGTTADDNYVMRVYLNPTISVDGTAKTPINVRPAYATASIATLQASPTASANGTLVEALTSAAYVPVVSQDLYILDPGQSMLITYQTADMAVLVPQISWYEL